MDPSQELALLGVLLNGGLLGLGEGVQDRLVLLLEEADEEQLAVEGVLLPVGVSWRRREVVIVGVGVDGRMNLGGWGVRGE